MARDGTPQEALRNGVASHWSRRGSEGAILGRSAQADSTPSLPESARISHAGPLHPDLDPGGLMKFSVVFNDRSLNHMSQRFQEVMRDLSSMLQEVYSARGVALVPGGGTCAMEAVARQFLPGESALILLTTEAQVAEVPRGRLRGISEVRSRNNKGPRLWKSRAMGPLDTWTVFGRSPARSVNPWKSPRKTQAASSGVGRQTAASSVAGATHGILADSPGPAHFIE